MDYLEYRQERLQENPELAAAYEQENLEREISRQFRVFLQAFLSVFQIVHLTRYNRRKRYTTIRASFTHEAKIPSG